MECVEPDPLQGKLIAERGLRHETSLEKYAPASFDAAYSLNVLEHIHADVHALATLRSRLRPDGRLFVYVPALPMLFSAMDRKVGHIRRYTAATLSTALRAAGFKVELCRYADCLGIPATLLYKVLGDRGGGVNKRALIFYDRVAFPLSRLLDAVMSHVAGKNVWALARNARA